MFRNQIHGLMFFIIVSAAFAHRSGPIDAADYKIDKNPKKYVLDQFESHDVDLLGTRHKKERILHFISNLIPDLHDACLTHIGLEICFDQQENIDHFMEPAFYNKWLDQQNLNTDTLKDILSDRIITEFYSHSVSKKVNKVENNDPSNIEKL